MSVSPEIQHAAHQLDRAAAGRDSLRLDLFRREPADAREVLGLPQLAIPRAPVEDDADQGEMEAHAAVAVAVDVVERRQHVDGRGLDARLLTKLPHGALQHGLAELELAADEAPFP